METVARGYVAEKGLLFLRKVGEGAFKETFLIQSEEGLVALKIVGPHSSHTRTQREIEAIQRCQHPGIASLIKVDQFRFESKVFTCLTEEYLSGGTLSERVNSGFLTRTQALEIGESLIETLAHLHSLRLVHRDIKPDNVMFRTTESWAPVLVDFGLVRDLSRSSITQTWAPMGPGTPYFAPPEQLNNRKEMIDWRSDQFSLGVTIAIALGMPHPYTRPEDGPLDCVTFVAAGLGPQWPFLAAVEGQQLPALARMVSAFPVDRFRTPARLKEAWDRQ